MTVTAVNPRVRAGTGSTPAVAAATRGTKSVPPPASPSRRRQVPLTPMRREAAKRMRVLAAQVQQSHPDMTVHEHLRDAARTLEAGNEEGAQRHLRAAMFALTPQSLMRNGLHTDDSHVAARDAMHSVHRHLLLVKDITDVAAKNQEALRRDSYGDDATSNPLPRSPVQADPNAGYGPGALAQKPTARQPPGNQALNAPAKSSGGGSDPAVADPVGPQPKGSKQFAYGWDDLARVIELVGPHGFIHGWIFVGIPGAGQKVTLGSGRHRTGMVERADATHLHVRMADGSVTAIPHHGNGAGKLAKVPTAVPQYASTPAGRDQLGKALAATLGAAPGKAGTAQGKRTQTELLARAVSSHPQLASDEMLNEHVAGMRASLNAGDLPSYGAHRDAAEARIRQHGMMPAGDLKTTRNSGTGGPAKAKAGKRAAGNEKQLSLLSERENGPDKTSGLMKAGDMQEGYQAIGQAPAGIIGGTSDPWWMAGPGGAFALSVRGTSGNRQLVPWTAGKQQENEAAALKATRQSGAGYFSGGSNYQQALAKTAAARALHEAVPLKASSTVRGGSPDAAAARKTADNVRFERGLTRGQREEAERRLYKAANHLDAGNHEEAASEFDAAMHATSLRGGGIIKGSTAAQARDLRDKVRARSLSTPGLTADGLNVTGASGGRRAQKAALAQAPLADLKAVDAENAHRAALLGKPGQVSATHQLVKDEIASRTAKGATVQTAYSWDDLAAVIELSAKTAQLEITPAPYGKPGGPGLYGVAGNKHSDYYEQVVKALMEKRGMDKGRASAVAWGVLRKWAHGGGGVHPEVASAASKALGQEAAASAKAHAHAVSWDQVSRDIELAMVIELFNPTQPRLPVGPGGGQFAGGAAAPPPGGQQPAGKAPAKAQPKPTAAQLHALHVAHVAHVNRVSTAKAGFMVAAQDDRAKASALIKQRDALAKALASAGGKVSAGQAGAKTAKTAKTKSTAPAAKNTKAPAAAKPAAAKPAAASSKTGKTATAKSAAAKPSAAASAPKATSAAGIKAQIIALNTQISALLAAAKQADAQAAKAK